MSQSKYQQAGVDLEKASAVRKKIIQTIQHTHTKGVIPAPGGFGALFSLDGQENVPNTILVSSTDGVGTKLKIAFATGRHDTIGQDLVAHCVNDILTQGASPLFFMDYLATSELDSEVTEQIIHGLAEECRNNHCALIGGETAQMPDFYQKGEYDLAGFIVGSVQKDHLLGPSRILSGNFLLGLPSSGLHTNGFSLARRILLQEAQFKLDDPFPNTDHSVADELLKVHRSYLVPLQNLYRQNCVLAAAHITGGGITENLPRILPTGFCAHVYRGSWPLPNVFQILQDLGKIDAEEMYQVFNMGIGMILVVPADKLALAQDLLRKAGETNYIMGEVVRGHRRVIYGEMHR